MTTLRRAAVAVACTVTTLMWTSEARAQAAWHGYVSANGAYQGTSTEFTNQITFPLNAETADLDAGFDVGAGPAIDINGGVRLWKGLTVGVGVTSFRDAGSARVSARLPHPFFFNRPREVGGDTGGFKRRERAVHVQAGWMIPAGRRASVLLFAGPSFFTVKQDLVQSVQFTESYPYDAASFTGVIKERDKQSEVGYHAGADVTVLIARGFGIGGVIRYSRATVNVQAVENQAVSIELGGLHAGVGVRVRF